MQAQLHERQRHLSELTKHPQAYYFQRLRQLIYINSEHHELLEGEVEADESYFGRRRKGMRGQGAAGKVPIFVLLKLNGKVYTVIIPYAKTDTLMPIMRQKVKLDSIVYTDTWQSYNTLDVSEFKHYRINHSELFANKTKADDDIEQIIIRKVSEKQLHHPRAKGIYANNFDILNREQKRT